jgi:hypothetical protein
MGELVTERSRQHLMLRGGNIHRVGVEWPSILMRFLLDLWVRDPRGLLRLLGEQAASTGRRGTRLTVSQVLDYVVSAGAPVRCCGSAKGAACGRCLGLP